MIGALQIYALKTELVDSGKMNEKEFHDRILKENSIPIEILRSILLEQELSRDHGTRWRFAGM